MGPKKTASLFYEHLMFKIIFFCLFTKISFLFFYLWIRFLTIKMIFFFFWTFFNRHFFICTKISFFHFWPKDGFFVSRKSRFLTNISFLLSARLFWFFISIFTWSVADPQACRANPIWNGEFHCVRFDWTKVTFSTFPVFILTLARFKLSSLFSTKITWHFGNNEAAAKPKWPPPLQKSTITFPGFATERNGYNRFFNWSSYHQSLEQKKSQFLQENRNFLSKIEVLVKNI